jgi:exodeoxyribonuclease VII small subunit
MTKENAKEDVNALSFEDALTKLENLVGQLENGKASLDEAIEAYTQGVALKNHCQKRLDEAKLKVEQLTPQEN